MPTSYDAFIRSKRKTARPSGFTADVDSPHPFAFQRAIVQWALRRGRAALFADTGLGKTLMQLTWADHVVRHSGGRVLVLAPLAVREQTLREAAKFGVSVESIQVLNYERLHTIDPASYSGVVLDESSILKSYDGATRTALIEAFQATPYRLACTATPAPNDHTELGNHAEFLGVCTRQEMLAEFFVHDSSSSTARGWRLKGHARGDFWRWVATWSVMVRQPADLGFDDDRYRLPPLTIHDELVTFDDSSHVPDGMLFAVPAMTLQDQRGARRDSVSERAAKAAELVASRPNEPWVIWCDLNDESRAIAKAIPDAVEVTGSDSPADKARALLAFADGGIRVLVTKPKIAGFGMNWQHCRSVIFAGVSHSYEAYYQAVRRCWRFGQERTVDVWLLRTHLDGHVAASLKRKARAADEMAREMVSLVKDSQMEEVRGIRPGAPPSANTPTPVPHWLKTQEQSCP